VFERRIDQVRIELAHETITLSWDSRQALLEHCRRLDGAA
jgi:hypothetical protein